MPGWVVWGLFGGGALSIVECELQQHKVRLRRHHLHAHIGFSSMPGAACQHARCMMQQLGTVLCGRSQSAVRWGLRQPYA